MHEHIYIYMQLMISDIYTCNAVTIYTEYIYIRVYVYLSLHVENISTYEHPPRIRGHLADPRPEEGLPGDGDGRPLA